MALLRKECMRRGMRYTYQLDNEQLIQMIKDDVEETKEDEPDWTARPPTFIPLHPGEEQVLQQELIQDIKKLQAREGKQKPKNQTPTRATGYAMCEHDAMCCNGDQCLSNYLLFSRKLLAHKLFACYYCFASSCGACVGLSPRQKTYTGGFVCPGCRAMAGKKAMLHRRLVTYKSMNR